MDIIERFDPVKKYEEFIDKYIDFHEFREKAILNALDKKDYHKVINHCLTGEEHDKNYAGILTKWKKYRYSAYEKMGDIENQCKIARDLLFQGSFEYYGVLKDLYRAEEWQTVLEEIISEFEKQPYRHSVYIQILIEEKLTTRLLEHCRQNTTHIENLYPHLLENHYEETGALFVKYINREAEAASDRKKYKKVCEKIKIYRKNFGSIQADQVIRTLKQAYARRPAFLEELSKLLYRVV